MRVRVVTWLASLAVLLLLIPAAQADQVEIYFTGATSGNSGGVGLNPYQFILKPVGGGPSTTLWLNCDDYPDHIGAGSTWIANIVYGSDTAGLLTTRMSQLNPTWNETEAARRYDAKAWLELNYSSASNPDYSFALWKIFWDSAAPANALYTAAMAAADADAATGYATYRQHLTIYTPAATQTAGPYIGQWAQELNSVPDGGVTAMLLGGALVGIEALRRRFRV